MTKKSETIQRVSRGIALILAGSLSLFYSSCTPGTYKDTGKEVIINLPAGELSLIPMNPNSVRIRFNPQNSISLEELIYTENIPTPEYSVEETGQKITLTLDHLSVVFDKPLETLTFKDPDGRILLQEKAG